MTRNDSDIVKKKKKKKEIKTKLKRFLLAKLIG